MLKVMRRVVQEVNGAETLEEALSIMVQRVREAVETQACTVFLMDQEHQELVMMATDGLNPEMVGKVRIKPADGLVGLVGKRGEPINVDDAPTHPSYHYIPEIGEERYKAFLGVPIVHHRRIMGVLIVQQEEARRFDEAEEAFLITMSAQLAGVIAHAEATGKMASVSRVPNNYKEIHFFDGIASVPGVGIGHAVVVYPLADLDAVPDRSTDDIAAELSKFATAVAAVREDIQVLKKRTKTMLPEEEQALFDVYLRLLDNNSLPGEVNNVINTGVWAEGALRQVIDLHIRQFEAMEDAYLRERAIDIKDLGRRVLLYLQQDKRKLPKYPEQTILIGDEVTASALIEVPEGQLMGVVSSKGSSNSHVAILARAMGIPTVMGVPKMPVTQLEGVELIVNGYHGRVYVNPPATLRKEFALLAAEERQLDEELEQLRELPAETPDNYRLNLYVNTGLISDVERSLSSGAEGVGLYRSEVPFMARERFPSEEEQRIIYRQLLGVFAPKPVTMRTLDVGGDKALPYFPIEEANPFLGWRGIRVTLDHPEVFLVQARAMLRASEGHHNLQIMFPMISCITEADEALRLLRQAYQELLEEGLDIPFPAVGVMVEVPSAVSQSKALASRFDFLSVGSNDLTQYILAVDRNNTRVANLYNALHPAVLRALKYVVDNAHAEGKIASICGEMAGDPAAVIALMAIGFDALSMSAASLPRMKWVIRNIPMTQARSLLDEVLMMHDPKEIRRHLENALIEADLGGLIWAGK